MTTDDQLRDGGLPRRTTARQTWLLDRDWTTASGRELPQSEIDRRLGEHLCVWCGQPIPDRLSPADTFCGEGCDNRWRQSVVADYQSGGVPLDRNEYGGLEPDRTQPPPSWLGDNIIRPSDRPIEVTQAELDAIPEPDRTEVAPLRLEVQPTGRSGGTADPASDEIGMMFRELARRYEAALDRFVLNPNAVEPLRPPPLSESQSLRIYPGPDLPPGFDYALDAAGLALAYARREPTYSIVEVDPPPGIVITQSTPQRAHRQGFRLGRACHPEWPALSTAQPPAETPQEWPVRAVQTLERQGYRLAIPTGSTPAQWEQFTQGDVARLRHARVCPRCGVTATAVPVTAMFPVPSPRLPGFVQFEAVRMTKLCCASCWLPYPGPPVVPMVRASGGGLVQPPGYALALVHPRGGGWFQGVQLMEEEVSGGRDGGRLLEHAWADLYDRLSQECTPWGCAYPGCEGRAQWWVLLGAAMVWGEYVWAPHDGEPLHMGLCDSHRFILDREIYSSHELSYRVLRAQVNPAAQGSERATVLVD
jgi:hypothetical protein